MNQWQNRGSLITQDIYLWTGTRRYLALAWISDHVCEPKVREIKPDKTDLQKCFWKGIYADTDSRCFSDQSSSLNTGLKGTSQIQSPAVETFLNFSISLLKLIRLFSLCYSHCEATPYWVLMAGHFLVSRLNVFIAGIIPFVLVPNSCSSLDTSSPSLVFGLDVFAELSHIVFSFAF